MLPQTTCRATRDTDIQGLSAGKANFTGRHLWPRGYCGSTVRLDEQLIRAYIKRQECEEKRQERMRLAGFYII